MTSFFGFLTHSERHVIAKRASREENLNDWKHHWFTETGHTSACMKFFFFFDVHGRINFDLVSYQGRKDERNTFSVQFFFMCCNSYFDYLK